MLRQFGLAAGITAAALIIAGALVFMWPLRAFACDRITVASWYGTESGSRTASGDYFDGSSLTAAMPSRSHLGERWRVSYAGRSVVVLVDDIGPAAYLHRGIDLSRAAAEIIGLTRAGVARVCLDRLG